jgi:hypothetical protein
MPDCRERSSTITYGRVGVILVSLIAGVAGGVGEAGTTEWVRTRTEGSPPSGPVESVEVDADQITELFEVCDIVDSGIDESVTAETDRSH